MGDVHLPQVIGEEPPEAAFYSAAGAHLLKHQEDALQNLVGNCVPPSTPRHPMALAMEWVAKITTVGLEMVLPGVGGHYLDTRLGTGYWAPIGFGVGMAVGILHLVQMTRRPPEPPVPAEELQDRSRDGTSKH